MEFKMPTIGNVSGSNEAAMKIGFVGLGVMGLPMAVNLLKNNTPLLVWSRSANSYEEIGNAGASIASTLDEVFQETQVVILMLANEKAIDDVLSRGTVYFAGKVRGHTIVNMGTTSPEYSRELSRAVIEAGGSFVEAPVSGSRKPAESGQLVVMISGDEADALRVQALVEPLCKESFLCGPVPSALFMKLSVNLFLITMVAGLAEAFHFARQQGVDVAQFQAVLDAGPMASAVSRMKLPKLVSEDYSVQASITDVLMNNRLITDAASRALISAPLISECLSLFSEAEEMGLGRSDMAAVICAIESRTLATR